MTPLNSGSQRPWYERYWKGAVLLVVFGGLGAAKVFEDWRRRRARAGSAGA